jgi:hypothetical protein
MANLQVDVENKDANGRALPVLLFPINFGTSQIPTEPPSSSLRKVTSCSTVNASGTFAARSGVPVGMEVYSTPGTYTFKVPSGVTRIKVELWGGGGAGDGWAQQMNGLMGGGQIDGFWSGSSGGYSAEIFDVKPGASYQVIVASGGSELGTMSLNGGDSSFSNLLSAGGGHGGNGAPGKGNGRLGVDGKSGLFARGFKQATNGMSVSPLNKCPHTPGGPSAFGSWGAGGSTCPEGPGGNGRAVVTW